MRYNGSKFSEEEASRIRREAAWHLRLPDPESGARKSDRRDAGVIHKDRDDARRRDSGAGVGVVHKTIDDARVAADDQANSWAEWVEAKIEERVAVLCEATGECVAALEHALEREIAGVRRDLQLLRNQVEVELKLDHRVAALKSEVARARSQAPDFKSDLSDLQEDVENLAKTAARLRAELSTVEFKQSQLAADQRQAK
jgi:hypothetical protein